MRSPSEFCSDARSDRLNYRVKTLFGPRKLAPTTVLLTSLDDNSNEIRHGSLTASWFQKVGQAMFVLYLYLENC